MIRPGRSFILGLLLLFAVGQAAALAAPCALKGPHEAAPCHGHAMPAPGEEGGDPASAAVDLLAACPCAAAVTGLPALVAPEGVIAPPPAPVAVAGPLLAGWRPPPDPPRPKPL
jgi:hypothetical protein